MIGGLIVTGQRETRVAVRVLGPSLNVNGVPLPGRLADPTLELHDSQGNVYQNDNWGDVYNNAIQFVGVPLTDPLESGLVVPLVPGNYTFIVRGKNNSTGVASVEAYQLAY